MPHRPDVTVLSTDGRRVLVVECSADGEISAESARLFRENLLAHGLVPSVPFYMLAYPSALFVWKDGAGPDQGPDFQAPAESILMHYIPSVLAMEFPIQRITMELVMLSWLGDITAGIRAPKSESEADQMLVDADILGLILGGTVISCDES